ncbi:class I SAM-dependent methyltransferase [Virgisporangium aurantiacum]|uniref:Methyltransferase n=1 Tax=Virgisporangium aurantiacum TaxID=175570 RepID=A0A8J4E3Z3_9ACTN|nr:class I SAM-dependent methyltransferase [Virgisporangium aurantiacum]GIJ58482.1 methyltransferase [Virgisporangium aurantiacum]
MFDVTAYGDGLASVYDTLYPTTPDADQAAQFVNDEAPRGRVVELGVGTGRLALPMVKLGLRVHGVDASQRMLDLLAERDREGLVEVTVGDFTRQLPAGPFDVGLVALNTLFMVPDRDRQIETLRLLRSRLVPSGSVVVETYNPWYYHRLTEPRVDVHHLAPDRLMIDTSYADRVTQTVVIVHAELDGGTPRKVVELSRYAWPSELDLMARLAGLRLRDRFGGWNREPVTPETPRYVSVFEVADADR